MSRPDDAEVRTRQRSLAGERRRFGYRRIRIFLRRQGFELSWSRAHRLWRQAGLIDRLGHGLEKALTGSRLLVLPILYLFAIRWLLFPWFGLTNTLHNDWYNHALSLVAFLFGFSIVGRESLWRTMERYRWIALALAVVALPILMVQVWHPGARAFWGVPKAAVYGIDQWAVIVAILGFGYRHLRDRGGPALNYLTQATFPLYLAHQTVLVAAVWFLLERTQTGRRLRFLDPRGFGMEAIVDERREHELPADLVQQHVEQRLVRLAGELHAVAVDGGGDVNFCHGSMFLPLSPGFVHVVLDALDAVARDQRHALHEDTGDLGAVLVVLPVVPDSVAVLLGQLLVQLVDHVFHSGSKYRVVELIVAIHQRPHLGVE